MFSQNRWYRPIAFGAVLILELLAGCSISAKGTEQPTVDLPLVEDAVAESITVVVVNADGSTTITLPVQIRSGSAGGSQTLSLAGSQSGPVTLDPALVRDAESSFIVRHLFRGLVRLDNVLKPVPDLAERIDISEDGMQYQFTLRSTVTFYDGTTISAQDVADSFNRATDPDLAGGDGWALPAATYLIDIEGVSEKLSGERLEISGIRVLDAETLQIQLKNRAANFLYKLSGSPALIVDSESGLQRDWWREPNASGPFNIAEFENGRLLKLEAVEDYWAGRPYIDSVEIRFGSDASNPLNLYESGQIDVVDVPNYAIDRVLTESDPLHNHLQIVPQFSTTFIVLNQNAEPYTDPAFRKAMFHALDREKIVEVSFESKVMLANSLVPPGILNRTWDAETPPFDVDEARQLLEEANTVTEPARVYGPGGSILIILKETLQEELGIELDVIRQSWPEFSAQLPEKNLPAFILSWIADYPDPENFLTSLFHSKSPDNYSGYTSDEVDQLLDAAGTEADAEYRAQLYLQAQQIIIDDGVLIPVLHDIRYTLVHPSIQNLIITPVGILTLDDVWIEN